MNPELAEQMFEEGGTLVLLGMPVGTEFGIDLNSWNVGNRFKGVKMIPPGLHFIYFSAVSRQGDTAPRTGFFHIFQQREVVLRHYDPNTEDLKVEDVDPDEVARIRANLHDLDRCLGAYPIDSWRKWVSLTQYVDQGELERMLPLSGRVCSVLELIPGRTWHKTAKQPKSGETSSATDVSSLFTGCQTDGSHLTLSNRDQWSRSSDIYEITYDFEYLKQTKPKQVLPEMTPKAGTEFRFSKFPSQPYRDGATPSEVTRYSLDSSYSVRQMMDKADRPESMLAELQMSFVCFLVGQVWDAWEQWRCLMSALCRAEELLLQIPELFSKFISIIHFQIQEVPEDLFVDIVESNNFLAAALTTLFANVNDNTSSLPTHLVKKAQRFKVHITEKFKWNLNLVDEGEDAPIIVETENVSVDRSKPLSSA